MKPDTAARESLIDCAIANLTRAEEALSAGYAHAAGNALVLARLELHEALCIQEAQRK